MDVAIVDGQRVEALLTEYLKDTRCVHLPYSFIPNNLYLLVKSEFGDLRILANANHNWPVIPIFL
jgi:hypothetical protein